MQPECLLTLDSKRNVLSGSFDSLRKAISGGADLRIYTGFHHNEHIDVNSDNNELVDEVSDFRETWLVDGRWVAGVMNMRMPVVPPGIFGARPSWSFFLYNENGQQAIARPFLDGQSVGIKPTGKCPTSAPPGMPKYNTLSDYDTGTNAPSQNFIYDFDEYRFYAYRRWREIYAHDEQGRATAGSFEELIRAFRAGREFKAAIRDFARQEGDPSYELFTHLGSGYYNTEARHFCINSQPLVVIRPAIPMAYESGNWSFGNMNIQCNGTVSYWRCDPYTMAYDKVSQKCAVRYFVAE